MALTVKDILELPSGQKMNLLAGGKGLSRPVVSVEIADYEFAPGIAFAPSAEFDLEKDMEPGSFIITSFLFAKDDPSLILSAVQRLESMGMAGLAYKQIIYDELPPEVLEFAEGKRFPLFSFGKTLWFENIIFDIMYAVQFDDKVYLSEEKIDTMLSGHMSRSELDIILKGISLKLRPFVTVTYIAGNQLDAGRCLRSFYQIKGILSKALLVRYEDGMFLITTSGRSDRESHRIIRREVFDALGLSDAPDASDAPAPRNAPGDPDAPKSSGIRTGTSDVRDARELDQAFRESWFCYVAGMAEGRPFSGYGETGICQVILPAFANSETRRFADALLDPLEKSADLMETVRAYTSCGGEIAAAASALHCHPNTIRYRLGRVRELTGLPDVTDSELFMQLKTAVVIRDAAAVLHRK